ncbi:MAG: acyl-CoA dehydrogenase family protein [Dehalococcoidia bacterium]
MDFDLNEQQQMLRTMARDFLSRQCTKARVRELENDSRGYDPDMLAKMAELGWWGLVVPEKYGGMGAGLLDLAVLLEEMGRNITPGPFFSTVALCALPLMKFGTEMQKAGYAAGINGGSKIWSLALSEESGSYDAADINCTSDYNGTHYLINGEKWFAPYAHIADFLIVICRTQKVPNLQNNLTAFIIDTKSRGLKIELIPTIAGDGQCMVRFKNVKAVKRDILGGVGKGQNVFDFIMKSGTILKCAEVSGACQAILDMTLAYAKERVQFDKPIGSFMAIQHKLVDMLTDVEGLQYLVYYAAWLLASGQKAATQISMAKAKAAEVYQQVCIDGVKIHGAIGFSMDHDMGCFFRRIKSAEFMLGDRDLHLFKVAGGIGL